MNVKLYRVIDANLNRSREGLRVCEDIVRFILNDARLSQELRKARHRIAKTTKQLPLSAKQLLASRDVQNDVGKKVAQSVLPKADYPGLFIRNIQRVEESLRVLEEVSKTIDKKIPQDFKRLRFRIYSLEKKIVEKLPSLRDSR